MNTLNFLRTAHHCFHKLFLVQVHTRQCQQFFLSPQFPPLVMEWPCAEDHVRHPADSVPLAQCSKWTNHQCITVLSVCLYTYGL